jgi:Leucyl-tRNA synthetase
MGEELWAKLGHTPSEGDSIALAPWPGYDEAMLVESEIEIPVQILGKVRSKIRVAPDASAEQLEAAALADERVKELLAGKTVRKVVAVPGRMVNIVAN